MIGIGQSYSGELLSMPSGTVSLWRKRLGLRRLSNAEGQEQSWRRSAYPIRLCLTCHAALKLLPTQSGRLIGWNDRGERIVRARKKLALWLPNSFDRARIPIVKAGKAKRHQWGKVPSIPNVSRQASPTKWLHYAYAKERRALQKLERSLCWSNHPLACSRMDTRKWYRAQTKSPQERASESIRIRYRKDQNFRARCLLRNTTTRIKRQLPLDWSSEQILGISLDRARQHIESQFEEGMGWHNQSKWHIDHIMPLCKFDLTDPAQARMAGNYKNLRPLWDYLNLQKQGRWTAESQQVWELLRREQGIFSN